MATTKKMTKKERFAQLLTFPDVAADPELVNFLNHEIDLVVRKNSAERKPTKKQMEQKAQDAEIRSAILSEMEQNTLYSADDMAKNLPTVVSLGLSAPKVSYLMRELVAEGKVNKTTDKRKVYYSLA